MENSAQNRLLSMQHHGLRRPLAHTVTMPEPLGHLAQGRHERGNLTWVITLCLLAAFVRGCAGCAQRLGDPVSSCTSCSCPSEFEPAKWCAPLGKQSTAYTRQVSSRISSIAHNPGASSARLVGSSSLKQSQFRSALSLLGAGRIEAGSRTTKGITNLQTAEPLMDAAVLPLRV